MELTEEQKVALKKLKVRSFRKDLRLVSLSTLRREFAAKSSGRILIAPLIRNLVFQAATWMLDGKTEKIQGNLRSLFYQWIKPVVSRIPNQGRQSDPYDAMCDALQLLVIELKLFRYRQLELVDENWENRWFTDGRNPQLLVFAEKTGFVMFLQKAQRHYGITTIALGGAPSQLSTEYLCSQLREKIGTIEPLVLFGITDHDPSGAIISSSFQDQLLHQDVEVVEYHNLIKPAHYTEQELEYFRFPIPSKYRGRIESWMNESGGIDGQPFGLEADSMPKSRLWDLLAEQIKPYLREL